ncbi:unnamed protein product (macronuclear) [Paramecium tetraurelia]|uniref:Uncharacterized protein n=1 Tax=Paramecium tetraurelia TaxID=5888 RepID=A0CNV5_PARTE|nr:uncharacterized protein GSPATT00008914001 [Paramecium tetraurelia]CAK72472.1 unnamed protein product [Paramecium tetraurelia]|eukprot:XP_001439869.1 hypothetical protein (macronuclear) [Paramecium tetraurelia strain d4-2]
MIKNYYKQSKQQSYISTQKKGSEFHQNQRSKSKSPGPNKHQAQPKQSNSNLTSHYKMAIGEFKYFQECFPEEYTILSINNEIFFEKDIIKCKQKDSQLNTTLEGSSDEDQTLIQDYTLQTSFNPINQTQYQHSSRFVYSNRERIFQERRTSLSSSQANTQVLCREAYIVDTTVNYKVAKGEYLIEYYCVTNTTNEIGKSIIIIYTVFQIIYSEIIQIFYHLFFIQTLVNDNFL